jgi:hypothetical protein
MTSVTKLLIINDKVKDYQTFINSRLDDTQYVVLNGKDLETDFRDKITGFDLSGLINIGLVFENTGYRAPFFEYTTEELALERAKKAEYDAKLEAYKAEMEESHKQLAELEAPPKPTADKTALTEYNTKMGEYRQKRELVSKSIRPSLPLPVQKRISPAFYGSGQFFSNGMMSVIKGLKEVAGSLQTIDIISCNIRDSEQFGELLALGLTVRYSTDITGQGGDWILESHDVNVTPVYFTDAVREYGYQLGGDEPPLVDGVYQISTAGELYWLMTCTATSSYPAPNLGSSYKLMGNIDMSDYSEGGAQSIGITDLFSGIFDGNNKIITIKDIINTTPYVGVFYNNNGTVTNTNVNYVNGLNMSISASEGASFVGTNDGTIRNSTVIINGGNITMTNAINGGFCGINNNIIENCNIQISGTVNMTGDLGFNGGFCGYNNNNGTISNGCTVTITGNVNMSGDSSNNGGFCGNNIGTIYDNCTVTITGNVNMSGDSSSNGGFCGFNNNTIGDGCTVTITSSTVNMDGSYNGGFCGSNDSDTIGIGCTVTINGDVNMIGYYNSGFCGINDSGTIGDGCIVDITGDVNMSNVDANNGGFCGLNLGTIGTGCTVTITGDVIMSGYNNGGFCGQISNTIGSNCTVTINGDINMSGDSSNNGGFCAYIENTILGSSCNVTINGNIIMTSNGFSNGGFCGYNNGTINSSSAIFNGTVLFEIPEGTDSGKIGTFTASDDSGTYTNCSVSYNSTTIFKNKATTPYIASPIGDLQLTESPNITALFGDTPFYFYNDSSTSILFNDTTYSIGDVFIYNNLSISITDLTVTIEIIPPVPSVLTNESYDIPCCTPLIPCNVNPQTGDNDYTEINTKLTGQTLGRNIDSVYRDINRGTGVLFATPPFKSYRDYMAYLQSKLR